MMICSAVPMPRKEKLEVWEGFSCAARQGQVFVDRVATLAEK